MSADPSKHAEHEADAVLRSYFKVFKKFQHSFNHPSRNIPVEDVIIASNYASGSNLTQHMVYQLLAATHRVPSDPDGCAYVDTTAVVPITELRDVLNLNEPHHKSYPQVWKTHLDITPFLEQVGHSRRKILYCIRNPVDVCRSFLDFTGEWFSGMSLADPSVRNAIYPRYFMEYFLECERQPDGSYAENCKQLSKWFRHVKSWTEYDNGSTLYLVYEDVIKDIPKTIQTISRFLSVPVTQKHIQHVALRCDRSWMARNPRMKASIFSKVFGLEEDKSCRTRKLDAVSFRDVLLPAFCRKACWRMFYNAIGRQTYKELVDELRHRNDKLFARLKANMDFNDGVEEKFEHNMLGETMPR